MSQTIITQTGSIVNYANIISMSVEKGELLNEQTGKPNEKVVVFGTYDSFYTANSVFAEVVNTNNV